MSEQTLFKSEEPKSRNEVAAFLRAMADKLDESGEINLNRGSETLELSVPGKLTFEIKVEEETKSEGPAKRSLELELEWVVGGEESAGEVSLS